MRRLGLAVLLMSCSHCSRADLSTRCAGALAASARASNIQATAAGKRVLLSGAELQLDARIEQEQQQGSQWVVGIAVTTSASGNSLSAASVGVGTSRADALETAIAEWVQLAGVAQVGGLVLKQRSKERLTLGGAVVYPGATGFRGPDHPTWSNEDHSRLLSLLLSSLGNIASDRLHSLSLTLVVDPIGDVQCDCRLDAAASAVMIDAAKKFPWPRLKKSYMFKQYYVAEGAS